MEHLREVFTRLKRAGLSVNSGKDKIASPSLSFSGHVITPQVSIDPERTSTIWEWKPPRDVKCTVRFIAMVNFCCKCMHNLAYRAVPINTLRKKGARFVCGKFQQEEFENLKKKTITCNILPFFI